MNIPKKFIYLFLIAFALSITSYLAGLSLKQALIIGIFATSILGTLFFWEFRLNILAYLYQL